MTSEHSTDTLGRIIDTIAAELEHHHAQSITTLLQRQKQRQRQRDEFMTAQQMCVALYGLQGCSDKHAFVRRLVNISADILHQCADRKEGKSDAVDILTLSNSVLGLQSMSNKSEEVRCLLGAMSRHLALCDDISASGQQRSMMVDIGTVVGNCLYGLQRMEMTAINAPNDDHLLTLITQIHNLLVVPFSSQFSLDSIQRALYGVASMLSSGSPSSSSFPVEATATTSPFLPLLQTVDLLLLRVSVILDFDFDVDSPDYSRQRPINPEQTDLYRELIPLYQALSLLSTVLTGPQCGNLPHHCTPQMRCITVKLQKLLHHLKPVLPHSDGQYNTTSATERVFYDHIDNYIQQHNHQDRMSVHSNEMVDGFSTDLLIRVHCSSPSKEVRSVLLNIEIDGPSHQFPRKKRFMELRDGFLKQVHGIDTRRIALQGAGYKGSKLDATLDDLMDEISSML